ncbi:penicillin-binding protein 2 [Capnocytophaga gingivalis]|uniref:penicillin-binding protein 2 n=1 Tax=Capnocytophaga gingivalis TaxID=1017 RepID=UPI0028EB6E63|nr:penicillin-binding protein 2 [Capnocytophaga gingivalis]
MKKIFLPFVICVGTLSILARLFYLQVFEKESRKDSIASDVAIEVSYDYPERGYIYDRNGKLLVTNQSAYDIMVIPREVKPLDTLEFCNLVGIDIVRFREELDKAKKYSYRKPSVFVSQLSKEEYAPLQEKLRKFSGFFVQKRLLRHYETYSGANVLGYISEVNDWELKNNPYYLAGEIIGRQGVEKQYEDFLRGKKGVRYLQKDKFNRVIGSYKNGAYDTLPVAGKSLELTIDDDLQSYGEILMQCKRGSIVAIDPKSGEILALVSAPSYDPNLLVGRKRSQNYTLLYNDSIAKPLFDRALLAEYPPGSTFKPFTALLGLQEGVMTPQSLVSCNGGYHYGNRVMKCHAHASPLDMLHAIATSCNAYFAHEYRKIIEKYPTPAQGITAWRNDLRSFGFGEYLGSDFPIGRKGYIPDAAFYNRHYGENGWRATTNISNGIGQGEVLVTPLQLANALSAIANKGDYYTPHIVRKIDGKTTPFTQYTEVKHTCVAPKYFDPIIKGMNLSYTGGTSRGTQIDSVNVAAKTGTAENYIRVNGKRMQLTDHSIFMAMAPIEDPKIAIVVVVENGYFGARIAGPIASLMIEKYLTKNVKRKDLEKRMIEKSLEEEYAKPYSGRPFSINQ